MRTKRVKWDNAGDGTAPAAPKPEDLRQKAEAAAARIVAQIKEDKAQSDDVFINDAPIATRDQLTRRAALAYVEQQTGTSIVIKGRFYPPGAPRDSVNPPIHLHITPQPYLGTDKQNRRNAVSRAAAHMHAILRGEASITSPVPPFLGHGGMQPPPDMAHLNPHMAPGPHMPRPFPGMQPPPQQYRQMGPGPMGGHFAQQPGMHPGMPPHNQMHPPAARSMAPVGAMLPPAANLNMPPGAQPGWQGHQGWHQHQQQEHRQPQGIAALPLESGAALQAGVARPQGHHTPAALHSDSALAQGSESPAVRAGPAYGTVAQLDRGPGAASQSVDGKQVAILPVDFSLPPGFDVVAHLRGPNNSYMAHIESETGAIVQVVETGAQQTSACPVEVHISAGEQWRQSAAVDLVKSLLNTVESSASGHSGYQGTSAPAPGGPGSNQIAPPNQQQPASQSFHGQSGYHSPHAVHANGQHPYHMQPQHQPAGPTQPRPHIPPPGFMAPGGPGVPMQGQPPCMPSHPSSMPQQSPGLNVHSARALQNDAATQQATDSAQDPAKGAGSYYSNLRNDSAPEKPKEKPAKRKFREFKEDAGTSLLRQDKATEDVQLPSYYKHLRDDTKPSEEGEELKEPATGYGAVYGPQNAPDASKGSNDHAANSQYAEAGTRLGLGAKGSGGLVPYGDD